MLAYRMEIATRDEMIAEDPFGGQGVFLALDAPCSTILARLERAARTAVQAVAWEGSGVWAVPPAGMSREKLAAAWAAQDRK